ncbi:MAG: rane protein AsmA family [Betaproteobacteria bacterium]|nr:rane protein AsmA family [Betaproteobacteria bacterium]
MSKHRALKWAGGIVLGLILLLVAIVALFDWNWLREPIARRVTAATGRSFAINGNLEVHLSLHPRIIANDIVMGNAEWAREPTMAQIRQLDFRIDLLPLLHRKLSFPEISLIEPRLALEVRKDDTPNWKFKESDKSEPTELPAIDRLTIDKGSASYRDPRIDTDLALEVRTLDGQATDPAARLEVTGKGRFKGMAVTARARGGALLSLRNADDPYPINASATFGQTKASIDGKLLDPLHLKGEQLNFTLEGGDLAQLFPIIGVPIPPTPPYKLAGFLDHQGDVWTFRGFKGKVGQSDLAGDFAVDRSRNPQFLSAKLVSRQLRMEDLAGFIGARTSDAPAVKPAKTDPDRVLPSEPYNLEKLQSANADISFRGDKIVTEKMPLEKMNAHLTLNNGVLKLAPLDFGVAGGNIVSQIEMDARKPGIETSADVSMRGLSLERMVPDSKLGEVNKGTFGGHAKLQGKGNSVAQMLGTANGEAAMIMDGGTFSELILRLMGLDIANSLVAWLGGDKQLPVRCMVGNFKAVDGKFNIDTLLIETPKVSVTGTGSVDLGDEALDLRLVSHNKGFSLASLRGPILVTGTFKAPKARPEMGNVAVRGGLAVVLGAVTAGIGALLPLLEFGKREDNNCVALMNEAKADAGVKESELKPRNNKK